MQNLNKRGKRTERRELSVSKHKEISYLIGAAQAGLEVITREGK